MLKVQELQNLSKEELVEKEGQLKKQLMQLRFDAKLGKLEKHSTIREARRDIARVLTVMNQQIIANKVNSKKSGVETKAPQSVVKAKSQSKKLTSRSAS